MSRKKILVILFALIFMSPLANCGLFSNGDEDFSGPEILGSITDSATGKGMPEVTVLYFMNASIKHGWEEGTRKRCIRIDLTTTDATGQYIFPAWKLHTKSLLEDSESWRERINDIVSYKQGYSSHTKILHSEKGAPYSDLALIPIQMDTEYSYIESSFVALQCVADNASNLTAKNITLIIKILQGAQQDVTHLSESSGRERLISNYGESITKLQAMLHEEQRK